MRTKLLVLLFTLFYNISFAQETQVLDANFENYLETHDADGNVVALGAATSMGNGVANDKYVTTARIENIASLNISNKGIVDMTGIEAFENLQILNLNSNDVTSIDLSGNIELLEFYAVSNSLVNLSLKDNTKLERIDVSDNDLISLDFRNGNNAIVKSLKAIANYQLYCFNVDDASALYLTLWTVDATTSFDENCGLTSITDTSFEAILENNNIGNGIIGDNYVYTVRIEETTTLDISNQSVTSIVGIELFQNLSVLNANSNDISAIDLSSNTALTELYLISNELTTLDLTANTNLLKVNVNDNDLTTFDFRNGNNGIIQSFNAIANYNLKCITIDDASLSSLALWNIDSGTSFNEDCNWTYVPDDNFENYLETHDADGNVVPVGDATSMGNGKINDDYVITAKIKDVLVLTMSTLSITDVTGIEGFVSLQNLSIFDNGVSNIDLSKNNALETLNLSKNNLTNLDVSNNTLLTELHITKNNLTNLDVSLNTALKKISCSQNQLNSLDVRNNTALINLSCYNNPLGSIDVTQNILLQSLDCVDTQLTSIDVSKNPELESLQVYENSLTSLDINANVKLKELYAEDNQITSLDVSKNTVLEDLSCFNNQLTYLNVRNGNNTNLDSGDFDIRNNPGLTCVSVDDPTYANANFSKKDNQTIFNTFCNSTSVPDANFEAYLETHTDYGGVVAIGDPTSMGNGIANDKYVGTEKIQGIKNLNISNQGIADFTALEGFESLEVLSTFGNTVSSLNLTANTKLREINCYSMGLSSINVSGLTSIERLVLRENNLTSIDLSSNLKLKSLYISNNNLNNLDVSANTLLTDIRVRENLLNTLDVTNNINLIRLYCSDNSLSTINVANNTLLETLSCGGNEFVSIDISSLINLTDLFIENTPTLTSLEVSNNVKLEDIGVDNNTLLTTLNLSSNSKLLEVYINNTGINTLDFSSSTDLEYVECKNNSNLTSLNFKSGNTSSIDEMYATGNPNLVCIQVDDSSASYLNSWDKDNATGFGEDCNWTYVPDDNFENYLETHDVNNTTVAVGDPTSMGNGIANDNQVATTKIEKVTSLDISSLNISDLTGIEGFTALESLNADYNDLTSLDLSSNTSLKVLDAAENDFTLLDLSGYLALEEVELRSNSITDLIVENNPNLKKLRVGKNRLATLDVTACTQLEELAAHQNVLVSLDVRNGNNNLITNFFVKGNASLTCIEVDDAVAAYLATWEKDATANFSENCNSTVWLGTNDDNWNETNNWVGNTAPQTTSNVIIPYRTNTPRLTSSEQINDLRVAEYSSFDISENGSVKVDGDFSNSGTFTMTSTASKSASLLVEGTANGQITYERGGLLANKWSTVSAPVEGQSIKDFVENPENNIRKNTTVTPNRYAVAYYNDSNAAGAKWVYYTVDDLAANTITFEKGRSYAISRATDGAVTFTGTITTENTIKAVDPSAWNAIGNPYTTYLPVNENGGNNIITTNTSKLDPAYMGIYQWDNAQEKYVAKTLLDGATSIAPGQGFLVKTAAGASNITFTAGQRSTAPVIGGTFGKAQPMPTINLVVSANKKSVKTTIAYRDNATVGLDPGYDIGNFNGASLDVYTQLADNTTTQYFTYQSVPKSKIAAMVIPVGIKAKAGEEISIAIQPTNLPEGVEVYLEDKEKNTLTKLTATTNQTLTLTEAITGVGRFYLHTRSNKIDAIVGEDAIKIYTLTNNKIIVEGITKEKASLSLYSLQGAKLFTQTIEGKEKYTIALQKQPTGVYIVQVRTAQGNKTKKIILN
ncbi:T9SS type A sorting domain-containing protein [uncultured Tenacibaculum sp.]|uniref:T9SS type A sorting domain-containing protein n=1 Tax=uncultured Tenacibaculum sp. TaxID=174713 RepID=UPI00261B6BFC|nr:T9SS type A sorting domain-containing protein [uncultured Tenacibaculum sp.]